MSRVRLVHITTVPVTLWRFFPGQIGFMKRRGIDVEAISSPGEFLMQFAQREAVPVHAVPMSRRITPCRDLLAVVRLWRLLRTIRPHIVHAHTPKAGLLGMIAASLAGVPVRVYHLRGLPMLTANGFRRQLLRWADRIACGLAHQVLAVGPSLRACAIDEGLCQPAKIDVLQSGSGNGVDAAVRFSPETAGALARRTVRAKCRIPADAPVIGFVGRIARDKGCVELTEAWRCVSREYPDLHLLAVGPPETHDPVPASAARQLRDDPRVHWLGQQTDTAPFYAAMDLCVLPSYREGFPNVPLEAAAMELPVVATRIPGCVDAVVDGATGTLVPPRDARALAAAVITYLRDPSLRKQHGRRGRLRVQTQFRPEKIWEAIYQTYRRLLADRRVTVSPRRQ